MSDSGASLGDILASALRERDVDWTVVTKIMAGDGRPFESIGVYQSEEYRRKHFINFTVATLRCIQDDHSIIPVIKEYRNHDRRASLLNAKQFIADGYDKTAYFRDFTALSAFVDGVNDAFQKQGFNTRIMIMDVWKETLNV